VESWVQTSLEATAQSPACLVALADLRLLEERLAEAEKLYLQVLPANDRHVVALNNLAWLKAFLHDKPPEALHWINRAIEVAGPRADLLDTRAVIHILARRADSAVRDLENALNEGPYAIGYLHLAEAKAMKGEFPAARTYLDKAREMHLSQDRLHPLEKQLYDRLIDQLPSELKDSETRQTRVTLAP
jgi:tetratricopeptide (TPR) repeat protein